MAETCAPQAAPLALEQRANLRQLQQESLDWLYAATCVMGLLWVAHCGPGMGREGMLGVAFVLLPYPFRALVSPHYLARAWLLVALWALPVLAFLVWFPAAPVACLLALPVALAGLLIGTLAGLLAGLAAVLVALTTTRLVGVALAPATWAIAALNAGCMLALAAVALNPMHEALRHSWEQYDLARRRADQARDTQADLKQAVKDLAEAGVQMARLNQLLGAARRVAEEAERAKAEFVATVSHELRTPLNLIIGFSEMMLNAPRTYGRIPRALQADLAVILRNSQHLSSLIDDVLDLSQIEAGRMALTKERVDLHEIAQAAIAAIRPLFESKRLSLTAEVPEGLVVFGDRTRLREVLLNLLSNAGRFTERGGVSLTARVEEGHVVVSVADTGPGIAPEDQEKLFRPFQQVDGSLRRHHGGTGLGLSISKQFVELHGGRMWLQSEPGRGTNICFRLPLEPSTPADGSVGRWLNSEWEYHQRTRPRTAPTLAVKPHLLVLESGQALQRLLGRYLGDVDITRVASLEEAAREFARVPAQALIVNDLAIGPALERLRQSAILPYGTPALVCAFPGEREAARSLGVADYLVKPISRDALLAALDRLEVRGGTILIVDDELEAIQLFWRMLTSSGRGYRVLKATSGERALTVLHAERPDVILLDLAMPGMDGFQLLAARNEEADWHSIPVIVTSARDPAGHPIASSALGITQQGGLSLAYLLKGIRAFTGIGHET